MHMESCLFSHTNTKRPYTKPSVFHTHVVRTHISLQRSSLTTKPTENPSKFATIDLNLKRKKITDRPAAAEHHTKENRHHKKKSKMSSSSSDKVRASHILIKHQGSRRKTSWKDPKGGIIRNTTRDDAVCQLKSLRDNIVSGNLKFEDLAYCYSDCCSAKRGGDLGLFGRNKMQKPFEEATYALKVGEISDIVDTDSGVHIIKRTG